MNEYDDELPQSRIEKEIVAENGAHLDEPVQSRIEQQIKEIKELMGG